MRSLTGRAHRLREVRPKKHYGGVQGEVFVIEPVVADLNNAWRARAKGRVAAIIAGSGMNIEIFLSVTRSGKSLGNMVSASG